MNAKIARKAGKSIGGTLFVVFLTAAVLDIGLASATEPENLRPVFSKMLSGPYAGDAVISQLTEMCGNETSIVASISGSQETISCAKIRYKDEEYISSIRDKVSGASSSQITEAFDGFYYRNYDCSFIDCIMNNQGDATKALVMISKKGNDLYKESMLALLALSVISGLVLFFSSEGWGKAKSFGVSFITVGITYFFVIAAKTAVPSDMQAFGSLLIDAIFGMSMQYFLAFFVIGIVLTSAGYLVPFIKGRKEQRR